MSVPVLGSSLALLRWKAKPKGRWQKKRKPLWLPGRRVSLASGRNWESSFPFVGWKFVEEKRERRERAAERRRSPGCARSYLEAREKKKKKQGQDLDLPRCRWWWMITSPAQATPSLKSQVWVCCTCLAPSFGVLWTFFANSPPPFLFPFVQGEIAMEGWLRKRGAQVKNIKKRYFMCTRVGEEVAKLSPD